MTNARATARTGWLDAIGSGPRSRRTIAAIGAAVIATIVALAAFDILRGYRATIEATGRELDSQAQVLAEQTARSVQAVDVVLRHLVEQVRRGRLSLDDPEALHTVLKEQATGLVQADGLIAIDAFGKPRAVSLMPPAAMPPADASRLDTFVRLRDQPGAGLVIGHVMHTPANGEWVFPIGRRIETPDGAFAGVFGARGRTAYFQRFYGDAYPDAGTRIALLHADATLLARHPPADAALGRRFPIVDELLRSAAAGRRLTRHASPLDGVDRFGVVRSVPDYPLSVIVTRDAEIALAPWRAQALGSVLRTSVLALLGALLLVAVLRQLARLDAARASLEGSRERFALAVAGSDDGLWDWNYVTGVAFASDRARTILGLPPGPELQPLDDWMALMAARLHPDDAVERRARLAAHLAGETAAYEGEWRVHAEGGDGWRWIRVRGVCVRDAGGRPLRIAGSVSDIDARRRAEQALLRSDERYQLAVDGTSQGLWDWDLATDLLFLSPRAQKMHAVEPGPPLKPRREWLALAHVHPDDAARVRAAVSAHLRGTTPDLQVEYRIRDGDGAWRWIRQRGVALRDAAGRPYRMAGSIEDTSAAKAAESERDRLEQQLRQAQKLEAIGTLAGGIAHDFNNILAAILGYGEMAQREAPEGTSLRRRIDATLGAALRAKSLVERILAFSRSGMGERVPVRVQAVVAEALDGIAASLPPGVVLERRLACGDSTVLGDPTQIHQVVMNLCANAVQAMKGAGRLAVSIEGCALEAPRPLATSVLAPGAYLRLVVADTGEGIAPEVRERIFDPFFTTKDVGVGTGLGLSLVHGIVTDLGGGIEVTSRPGEGATFRVYLPCAGEAPPDAAPPPAEVPLGEGETVLLVDDEEPLVRLGEEMLAELGYEPVGYTSGAQALAAFRAAPDRFRIVLSDEAMPEMTGSELVAAIRRLRPAVPIVLMSGFVTPALAARAREQGVAEVLAKPLGAREIARSLAGALRAAEATEAAVAAIDRR